MIKNDRQYRITKAQARKFAEAITSLEDNQKANGIDHPILKKAHNDSLKSQYEELLEQIEEYEELKSGNYTYSEITSLEELPQTMIRARIAKRLTQKMLGKLLGLKEQQIQRYEASNYSSASFDRLLQICSALDLKISDEANMLEMNISIPYLLDKLNKIGIDREFIKKKLLDNKLVKLIDNIPNLQKEETSTLVNQILNSVSKIFMWTPSAILEERYNLDVLSGSSLLGYKKLSKTDKKRVSIYTFYSHVLSLYVIKAIGSLEIKAIPKEPEQVREEIISKYGKIDFVSVLEYVWSLGIPVIPLSDSGYFHGACFRHERRNVIVLKQKTMSSARWMFDLFHELWHASRKPDESELTHIEIEPDHLEENMINVEEEANLFAGNIVLEGKAEILATGCVEKAKGKLEYLKSAVIQVSKKENIQQDSLANYLAYRLSMQGENWWGAANNLQKIETIPFELAKEKLLSEINLELLNRFERNLLLKAIS